MTRKERKKLARIRARIAYLIALQKRFGLRRR